MKSGPIAACVSALLVLWGLVACQSVPSTTDRITQSATQEDLSAILSYRDKLLDLRLHPDPSGLAALRRELSDRSAQAGVNRDVQAKTILLQAEAALLAGDGNAAKSLSDKAAALSTTQEGLWYVRAALEADPAKRLALLSDGIRQADEKSRLLCERGEAYVKTGQYAQAAQDLDEGLRGLDPNYLELYGADRDKAFALARASAQQGSVPAPDSSSLDTPLTLRQMVERAARETKLLATFSSAPTPSIEALLPAVKNAGLLLDAGAPPDGPVLRKQAAYFIWGLVARAEHDPKLLQKYSTKYKNTPVPDVPADAPWFDAALGVVEREIMDLPDGVNFKPDETLTGIEYLAILSKLGKQYR